MVLNVSDPEAAANWYRQHLGMKDSEPTRSDGRAVCLVMPGKVVLIELWTDSADQRGRQNFRRGFPQQLVVQCEHPKHEVFRLINAGATGLHESPAGLTVFDPFGLEVVLADAQSVSAA